ncbi:MAG: RNA polymerase sigma factor [Acidimicrobiia bacterium]
MDASFDAVVDAARAGEEWAITHLYRELHPRLLRYLRAREPGSAEDLEAEVWGAIALRIHRFEGDAVAFRAWAFAIARRRLADHRRSAARRRTEPVPPGDLDAADGTLDPEAIVLDGLDGEAAAAFVVRSLPPDQADVVLLRVLAGLDVEHVASLLGKRPGTIRVLQHRALKRLERRLGEKRVTR